MTPNEPWFGRPEECASDDEDNIESTRAFYDLLSRLVSEGFQVDVIDSWNGEEANYRTRPVSLKVVPREEFRFFEGYRFEVGL
jgi:hypothetical protein